MVQAWWACGGGACHTCSSHSTVTDRVFNGAPCSSSTHPLFCYMSGGADGRGSRKCAGMVRVYCCDNLAHVVCHGEDTTTKFR